MRRSIRFSLLSAVMVILTACAADDSFRPIADVPAVMEVGPAATVDGDQRTVAVVDTARGYLVVGPQGGNWVFGEHKINFPANSICDMSQTNYFEWGKPCTPISAPVRIDLKWWRDAEGHPHVDFEPALRFQPTRKGEVTLYLKDAAAARAQNPVIRYCALAGVCVNEALLDPSLATRKDNKGGFVYRIIRHFSGYNVWA